jgi:hypothetical protein
LIGLNDAFLASQSLEAAKEVYDELTQLAALAFGSNFSPRLAKLKNCSLCIIRPHAIINRNLNSHRTDWSADSGNP